MKANELMTGNIINWQLGHTIKQGVVTTISPPIVVIDHSIKIKEVNLIGIPLTEEWLVKFGFDRVGEWIGIDFNPRMGIRFYNGNSAECDITQDDKFIAFKCGFIQYVHQLQNLYFALTGEELNIQL